MKRRVAVTYGIAAGLACWIGTHGVHAQQATPYTLHVYTNLVQVPALVLTDDRKPLPPIKREQFAISLDHGPLFHPSQMRIEGDDAISLAVLLDVSGGSDDIVKSFVRDFPMLAPAYLHPKDHVSIYAIDCVLVQSVTDISADAAVLQDGVVSALAHPELHGTKQHGACARSVHLWDAVVHLSKALGESRGRHVLLVVSSGKDGKSTASFTEATTQAVIHSVAIFGLRDLAEFRAQKREDAFQASMGSFTGGRPSSGLQIPGRSQSADEDLFDILCSGDGGFVENLSQRDVAKSLQNFVTLLRSRYILEYPRPEVGTPGIHTLAITVPGTPGRVWVPGVTYPTPDPALLADPSTVHTTPSPATFGTRRPLDSQ